MSTIRRTVFALAGVALVTAPALATAVQPPAPMPGVGVPVAGAPMRNARRGERHPEIRKAIRQLQRARTDLQNANRDFGGHRADALAATDNAIRQLQLALQYDRQ